MVDRFEKSNRLTAEKLGMTYEEYMERQERNRGMIDLRKAEVVAADGEVYYIDEYEEKFEGKVNPRGPAKISGFEGKKRTK